MKVTLQRLGRNLRLVLMLEWLTLWPTWGPLAVSSQRRDIFQNPLPSPRSKQRDSRRAGVQIRVHFQEPRTYRGRRVERQGLRRSEPPSRGSDPLFLTRFLRANRCQPRIKSEGMLRSKTPWKEPGMTRFISPFQPLRGPYRDHIKGVFPADIRVPEPD